MRYASSKIRMFQTFDPWTFGLSSLMAKGRKDEGKKNCCKEVVAV